MKIAIVSRLDKEIKENTQSGISAFLYSYVPALARRKSISSIDVYGVGKSYFDNPKINFINLLDVDIKTFLQKKEITSVLNNYPTNILREHSLFDLSAKAFTYLSRTKYDIIHDNSASPLFYIMSELSNTPIVTTLHTSSFSEVIYLPYMLNCINNINHSFVSISLNQKKLFQSNTIAIKIPYTILHGIDVDSHKYSLSTKQECPTLWIGRLQKTDDKGVDIAIEIIKKIQKKLTIVGVIKDKEYFDTEIATKLNENITYIDGDISLKEKNYLYQNASMLLYPLKWEEPFGLVFLEAMAAGTPIIAFARGAVPEIIKDGITGFIVNPSDDDVRGDWITKKTGVDGLYEAIEKMNAMSEEDYHQMRKNCRTHIEKNFTIERMVKQYGSLYEEILAKK
jgi:glycosyltransferase involved in cell wall biosynthesis